MPNEYKESPRMPYSASVEYFLFMHHRTPKMVGYRPAIKDKKAFIQYIIDRLCAVCSWNVASFNYSWKEISSEYLIVSLFQENSMLFQFVIEYEPEDESWFVAIDDTDMENHATQCLFVTIFFNIATAAAKTMEELDELVRTLPDKE